MAISSGNTFIGANAYSFNSATGNGIQYVDANTVQIVAGSATWNFSAYGALLMQVCGGHSLANPPASTTLNYEFPQFVAPSGGSIVQACIAPSYGTSITAGTTTLNVQKNGSATGMPSISSVSTRTASNYAVNTYTFAAGDVLHVSVSTSAGFTVTTGAYLEAYLIVAV